MTWPRRFAFWGFLLALSCALALALAGPAYRIHVLDLGIAFKVLEYAAYGGITAAIVSLPGLLARTMRSLLLGTIGLALGCGTAWIPWHQLQIAKSVPPIHDISTDTDHPPEFVAILPLRATAPNPAAYGGPELAAQQKKAYADVRPLLLATSPGEAFSRALTVARTLGWEIVASDAAGGRIEATDTTFWFGFKDDAVVRVTTDAGGSRVDVRSVSRVGQSDVGANAARIRRFLAAMRG